nr:MAG TPA: hypothetical protein [Caudoviricetes sp.]
MNSLFMVFLLPPFSNYIKKTISLIFSVKYSRLIIHCAIIILIII